MKRIGRDIQHYTPLFAILAMSLFGFKMFPYDRSFQSVIIIAAAAGYVSWGLIHHYIHQDLHLSIVMEYIGIGTVGMILVLTLLANA